MNRKILSTLVLGALATLAHAGDTPAAPAAPAAPVPQTAQVGQPAPAFTLTGPNGPVKLADFQGKILVLEWTNPECPFVKRHLAAGTMKTLAQAYKVKGVEWLAINSTYKFDAAANLAAAQAEGLPYPLLTDQDGAVGTAYGARTTPHMFVIDGKGVLAYAGAIDDDKEGSKGAAAHGYVQAALDDLLAGRPVATPETRSYGCSVKYQPTPAP